MSTPAKATGLDYSSQNDIDQLTCRLLQAGLTDLTTNGDRSIPRSMLNPSTWMELRNAVTGRGINQTKPVPGRLKPNHKPPSSHPNTDAGIQAQSQTGCMSSGLTIPGSSSVDPTRTVYPFPNDKQRRKFQDPQESSHVRRAHPYFKPGELSLLDISICSTPELTPSSSIHEVSSSSQVVGIDAHGSESLENSHSDSLSSGSSAHVLISEVSRAFTDPLRGPKTSQISKPGIISHTPGSGSSKTTGSRAKGFSTRNAQNTRAHQRRQRNFSDDEDDAEDGQPRKQREPHKSGEKTLDTRLLACPYYKHDPVRYSRWNAAEKEFGGCEGKRISSISRLKQHLQRVHQRPRFYCGRCYQTDKTVFDLEIHSRMEEQCQVSPPKFRDCMTEIQAQKVKERRPGKTAEENWIFIWKILFPDQAFPDSVYINNTPLKPSQEPRELDSSHNINSVTNHPTPALEATGNWHDFPNDAAQTQGLSHEPLAYVPRPAYQYQYLGNHFQLPHVQNGSTPQLPEFLSTTQMAEQPPAQLPTSSLSHYALTSSNPFYYSLSHRNLEDVTQKHQDPMLEDASLWDELNQG